MVARDSSTNKKKPIGAVMVVGGGIAGMQASLDLAEQGFKVYLIEKDSAIGGHMAQLDKTFPTNDCAMCTISPKLVETGRHPNIEILTNREVLDVSGQEGNFFVRLEQQPRYVDSSKCIGCGDCSEVCPIVVPDKFNEGLSIRRAIYKLYPQAVPNAFAIEKRGMAACRDACPAHQRAQGYIALIREGRWQDALRVIKMDNPFPGICGRICNHRCETACNRGLVDEPINIRALKRFVTDKVYAEPRQPVEKAEIKYPDKKVAIIGAGPCGLTAAQDVIQSGYPVTIFEAMPVAGGMLRLGVPEYRLPTDVVEREVQDILDLGIELRLNTSVTNLDDLFTDGYAAVLIAVGAHEGVRLPIPGSDLDGVVINMQFLRDVRLGRYERDEDGTVGTPDGKPFGPNVLVLGGGNVAIDVARSAVRLGCKVSMACLESREQMPSHSWEIEASIEDGITIYNSRTFEQVTNDGNGHVSGVECMMVDSFGFDEAGRLNVEKVPGSNHVIPCDTVVFAVGQRVGLAFVSEDAGIGLTAKKTIAVDPGTFSVSRPGVFAAGDSVSGTSFVIDAVASGHDAAESILRYLQGEALERSPEPELPVVKLTQQEVENRIALGEIAPQPRVPLPELSVRKRINSFDEIEGGYDDESAQQEAARCLACGVCSECMSCVFACGREAVDHDMTVTPEQINVGAIILAPGYQIYRAELSEEYGLRRYPNVVTALQYERMLSASGPTKGMIRRPSDEKSPKRIAFLQCVGSRDQSHDYCSSVCCMYAAKEAIMTIEHARAEARSGNGHGEVEIEVFFMDTRAYSKGYEEYYRRAEKKYGVKYTRCRLSEVKEDPHTGNLIVQYAEPYEGRSELVEKEFDLVVLSVGMEISESVKQLGHRLGIELDRYGFCHTTLFDPLQTSRPGIYVAGPFREPKDIPETVVEASGAAASAARLLSSARHALTQVREYPEERDVSAEGPRIGVFVCHCGSNIGGYLDVPAVSEYASSLPGVVHAENNLYTCSQDTIAHIIEQTKNLGLNRVVVASCTPLTHEPLFQDALRLAGISPYLFEMANIRNQCSWVHSSDWERSTEKTKKLVQMAVARASRLEALPTTRVPVKNSALIIGGGIAGMTSALTLADQGFPVHLVEKTGHLGGNLRDLHYFVPATNHDSKPKCVSPKAYLAAIEKSIRAHPLIAIHLNTELQSITGFKGNFSSTLRLLSDHSNGGDASTVDVQHGAVIVATGGREYKGPEYGYGEDPRIVTQQEFEALLARKSERGKSSKRSQPLPSSVVMIQCVGPAERFCSRLCCTVALKNAIKLKEMNPNCDVTIVYRDIRTYGFKEQLYTEARRAGIRFMHYDFDRKPEVVMEGRKAKLKVKIWEQILGRNIVMNPDLVVLSMPVVPPEGIEALATQLKLPMDMDGFFLEAHVKLRPVDFTADGIFMAGLAHYPKFLDETIAQAQAAASRAASILSQDSILTSARVAIVDAQKCVGCLTCVRVCPYDVPKINPEYIGVGKVTGAAYIEPAVCHGCGSCAAECPAQAIQVKHYKDLQTFAKIDAIFNAVSTLEKSKQP